MPPPPKKPDKKAPAQAEEDLSDLSSLPHIKVLTFTTLYNFYLQKSKDAVREGIEAALSEESLASNDKLKHIKTINRKNILEDLQGKSFAVKELTKFQSKKVYLNMNF